VVFAGETGGHVLVTEFRDMALNFLFCADVLRPLDLVPPPSLTLPTNITLLETCGFAVVKVSNSTRVSGPVADTCTCQLSRSTSDHLI